MAIETNIRVLVPRVRRAVEGPLAPAADALSDDAVKDIVADALSEIILYTGSAFGKTLLVTAKDDDTQAPTEYATSDELTLPESSVVAAQAAVNFFFYKLVAAKHSERIRNEGGEWEWSTSANVLRDGLKALTDARDRAIQALEGRGNFVAYESFLAVRDSEVSHLIEPWVDSPGTGGMVLYQDHRFGGV